ncbi:(2Fe-2S)-binding protein [Kocuria coralli]|uniref:(2Fe-2S)-binding protein n=1 Tax=Kocuria coralli TaxID=1461025 RepID=UPI0015F2C83D|nr:(2Fe-2S)-binding protein [Kocuria coralli]
MPAAEENLRPAAEDHVICRCEDVTLAEITAVLDQIGDDASPTELKRRLRAGMGWCQGRVCGPALARITGTAQPLMRSRVVRPVLISQVAEAEDGAAS